MANLISQMEQALNELKLKEAKIKEDEERLQKEKEWVVANLKKDKKIKLNVGGTYYTTTLTTLQSDPNSMIAAMFSGRFPIEKDEDDGAYFIDRDGRVFGHILTWLRTGEVSPKLSEEDLFFLQKEAEYFQLVNLQNQLKSSSNTESKQYIIVPDYFSWKNQNKIERTYQVQNGRHYTQKTDTHFPPVEDWIKECIIPFLQKGYTMIAADFNTLQGNDHNRIILIPPEH